MTLTWVICGAGRRVGKTRLAQSLCRVLPNAVYAKQGCGRRQSGKPVNFFRTAAALASFIEASRRTHEHIVVESNELVHNGGGDIVVFLDGIRGRTDFRSDADLLRSRAHLRLGSDASIQDWDPVLQRRLASPALRAAVREVLSEQHCCLRNGALPVLRVEPLRVSTGGGPAVRDPVVVVVEELLTIVVEDAGSFALLCTPCDVEELAIGFAFSEGMISSIDDVSACTYRAARQTVGLRLGGSRRSAVGRNLIVTSSCGLYGRRNVDELLSGRVTSGDSMRVPAAMLQDVAEQMRARQELFSRTGGTHAAGVFTGDGELIAFGEDIGRHNALDKAIGRCLKLGLSLPGRGAVLSGRVSLELVAKAARSGLELVVAVSAPSSLALQAAERCNITVCGFVRGERATVYTHPRRIVGIQS